MGLKAYEFKTIYSKTAFICMLKSYFNRLFLKVTII